MCLYRGSSARTSLGKVEGVNNQEHNNKRNTIKGEPISVSEITI